jgi:hypothetical protein
MMKERIVRLIRSFARSPLSPFYSHFPSSLYLMTTSFTHQVGGHPSTILSSPLSSSTLIKPSSPTELNFYQSLGPRLANGEFMREWCPAFYGTLKLQGKMKSQQPEPELNDDISSSAPAEVCTHSRLSSLFY